MNRNWLFFHHIRHKIGVVANQRSVHVFLRKTDEQITRAEKTSTAYAMLGKILGSHMNDAGLVSFIGRAKHGFMRTLPIQAVDIFVRIYIDVCAHGWVL